MTSVAIRDTSVAGRCADRSVIIDADVAEARFDS
jgi:hypothetical protein